MDTIIILRYLRVRLSLIPLFFLRTQANLVNIVVAAMVWSSNDVVRMFWGAETETYAGRSVLMLSIKPEQPASHICLVQNFQTGSGVIISLYLNRRKQWPYFPSTKPVLRLIDFLRTRCIACKRNHPSVSLSLAIFRTIDSNFCSTEL